MGISSLLRGKNKNVLELPKSHFKDIKKVADFPYVRGGRGDLSTYGKFHVFFADHF